MRDRVDIVLPFNPANLCTAQQKKVSFKQRRIFTNPKVLKSEKAIALLARRHQLIVRSFLTGCNSIKLSATYFYNYPKSTPKKAMIDNAVKVNGADLDNIHKSVQDALGLGNNKSFCGAGFWDDDRYISTLTLRKRYTIEMPRIEISIERDS